MDIDKWLKEECEFACDFGDRELVVGVEDLKELLKTHTLVPNEPVGEVQGMIRVDWANEENTKVIAFIDKDKKLAPGTKLYASQENNQ